MHSNSLCYCDDFPNTSKDIKIQVYYSIQIIICVHIKNGALGLCNVPQLFATKVINKAEQQEVLVHLQQVEQNNIQLYNGSQIDEVISAIKQQIFTDRQINKQDQEASQLSIHRATELQFSPIQIHIVTVIVTKVIQIRLELAQVIEA
ncbi:unnamed protein product [Paramecium octaurelia]|uniref:Uncharacterized protein n=1 Tax=Paramecium octaurelia TaxID=43137 RepID=A0A8S1XCL8_PAROT|nr:unnamed protein product [Paramecium octaurelia]